MTVKLDILGMNEGYVRLVDSMGSDLDIVRAARVSFDADWRSGEDTGSDARLINYLYANGHTSPFEMVEFKFEVKAPIFIFRQWHRHRTWSYNEVSARYTELDEGFYVPQVQNIGIQSKDNKQSREIGRELSEDDMSNGNIAVEQMRDHFAESHRLYRTLLDRGVPRELARSVLPVAAYSRMFAKVDLHNLFGFLRERLHPHAQYEIRMYAEAMLELITPIVPVAVEAFKKKHLAD